MTARKTRNTAQPDAEPLELVTVARAGLILDVHPDTVRRMVTRGDLEAVRLGTGLRAPIRIPMSSIRAALHPLATVGTIRAWERGDAATPRGGGNA